MSTVTIRRAVGLLVLALLVPVASVAQLPATEYQGAAELGLELRRLGTIKRVLMIGAHPDDESTQILSTLALGQGADVAYLSLTRGEGGQNGIGPELQEGLGLLRTEELLAARRLDGARQYFTRAYDFGFSKNAEEAFRHWPREEILADVVAAIRHFRPDVVLSVFSGTPRDGHGHHQVAGILAREAFETAGDPDRFPEQLRAGLRPFAPRKLYQTLWGQNEESDFSLQTGQLDPLLGSSHYQVAMASRSRHRSQDMGRPLTPGPQASGFELVAANLPGGQYKGSLFAGVDTTLSATLSGAGVQDEGSVVASAFSLAREYEDRVGEIREGFNPLASGGVVEELAAALRLLRNAVQPLPAGELRATGMAEVEDVEAALWSAARLQLEAVSNDETLVPGQSFELTVTLWNGGDTAVALKRVEPVLPEAWTADPRGSFPARLAPGELTEVGFDVKVPQDADFTRPYFLRQDRNGDLYVWADPGRLVGVPFGPAAVRVAAEVEIAGEPVRAEAAGAFLEVDRRQGEIRRPIRVVPAVSVLLTPEAAVVPLSESRGGGAPLTLSALVRAGAPDSIEGIFSLQAPAGWRVEPTQVPLRFSNEGEQRRIELRVIPPAELHPGDVTLTGRFVTDDGRAFEQGYTLVDYPHVDPHPLYRDAVVSVHPVPVEVPPDLRVGYVPGAGDDAPEALRQLGIDVTVLDGERLATGDLSRFDAILTGTRAYEVNADLLAQNRRLLEYARQGGTVVVQYSKYEYAEPGIAPYPVEISRPHDRVTDETAEVRLLEPSHPALSWPNRITAADFQGWVQERGLYFLSEWDDTFTPLLEMADPGEDPLRGSLLVAPLGAGTYVYTGLAFFRQLPQGVPGAYRLLVNLLSLGENP